MRTIILICALFLAGCAGNQSYPAELEYAQIQSYEDLKETVPSVPEPTTLAMMGISFVVFLIGWGVGRRG